MERVIYNQKQGLGDIQREWATKIGMGFIPIKSFSFKILRKEDNQHATVTKSNTGIGSSFERLLNNGKMIWFLCGFRNTKESFDGV